MEIPGGQPKEMRTFWKVLSVALGVMLFATLLVNISMYYWPSIPSSPRPAEGRVYPLNNHGSYTYMNRQEYLLREECSWVFLACFAAFGSIQVILDPFDQKRRPRMPKPWPWQDWH
jgi:hypothetical protein